MKLTRQGPKDSCIDARAPSNPEPQVTLREFIRQRLHLVDSSGQHSTAPSIPELIHRKESMLVRHTATHRHHASQIDSEVALLIRKDQI